VQLLITVQKTVISQKFKQQTLFLKLPITAAFLFIKSFCLEIQVLTGDKKGLLRANDVLHSIKSAINSN
jgi:hypothetical protein